MSVFDPVNLGYLAGFSELFKGFTVSWDFDLPQPLLNETLAFAKYKGWEGKQRFDFIESKKADYAMTLRAKSKGFPADMNDEGSSHDPWHDFWINLNGIDEHRPKRVKFESKRMPGADVHEISFLHPFTRNESCMKWRDYDLLLAWHVNRDNRFKPWALVSNRLFAADMWEQAWVINNGQRGGKHLCLDLLPEELREGVAFL